MFPEDHEKSKETMLSIRGNSPVHFCDGLYRWIRRESDEEEIEFCTWMFSYLNWKPFSKQHICQTLFTIDFSPLIEGQFPKSIDLPLTMLKSNIFQGHLQVSSFRISDRWASISVRAAWNQKKSCEPDPELFFESSSHRKPPAYD